LDVYARWLSNEFALVMGVSVESLNLFSKGIEQLRANTAEMQIHKTLGPRRCRLKSAVQIFGTGDGPRI
jgi:hypothetical protein